VLETVPKREEKDCKRIGYVQQTPVRPGTPDCPVVHRTVSGAPGWSSVNSPLSGFDGDVRLKITGLSGGSPDCPVSQRSPEQRSVAQSSHDTWNAPTASWCTGQCPVRQSAQRSNGRICQIWKEISHQTVYRTCPVAHRAVRGTTRQNARIAFLVGLQRLLGAFGL
jgi:hypothetical protein